MTEKQIKFQSEEGKIILPILEERKKWKKVEKYDEKLMTPGQKRLDWLGRERFPDLLRDVNKTKVDPRMKYHTLEVLHIVAKVRYKKDPCRNCGITMGSNHLWDGCTWINKLEEVWSKTEKTKKYLTKRKRDNKWVVISKKKTRSKIETRIIAMWIVWRIHTKRGQQRDEKTVKAEIQKAVRMAGVREGHSNNKKELAEEIYKSIERMEKRRIESETED